MTEESKSMDLEPDGPPPPILFQKNIEDASQKTWRISTRKTTSSIDSSFQVKLLRLCSGSCAREEAGYHPSLPSVSSGVELDCISFSEKLCSSPPPGLTRRTTPPSSLSTIGMSFKAVDNSSHAGNAEVGKFGHLSSSKDEIKRNLDSFHDRPEGARFGIVGIASASPHSFCEDDGGDDAIFF
mmetsp:Transcript_83168/g.161861  ORF Transcript_83168/g.161861 Transcript_83168/m.161861 type:complete len:183 (-) Transcript_83168:126-674(-)